MSSIAAATSPPGPNTGIATPQAPASSSKRVTATRVSRVTASARRKRSGEVTVCAVYGRSPRMIVMSTTPGGEKASSARPSAVGWAGSVAAGLNDVTGPWPGLLLDVGDLELLQHAQPGPAAGGGGEVLQHAGRALLEGGGAVGAARHHAQRQPRAVEPVRRALQQPPRGELGGEPVRGGDGQACEPSDLGEAVLTALRERHQDRGDLAGDRTSRLGRVACHGAAPPTSSCDLRVGQENTAPLGLPVRHSEDNIRNAHRPRG